MWIFTSLIQTHDVISQVGAPGGGHDFDSSQVFAELDADLAHLQCQLTSGHHDNGWRGKMNIKYKVDKVESVIKEGGHK